MSSLLRRLQIKMMKAAGLRRHNPNIVWPLLMPANTITKARKAKKVVRSARGSRRGTSKDKA